MLAFALASWGCSGSSGSPSARTTGAAPTSPSEVGPAGAAGGPNASAGSSATNNPTLIVPVTPAGPIAGAVGAGATSTNSNTTGISRDPIAVDECGAQNPAGLSSADAQKLWAAGAPGMLKLLNPYEGTVFPRGLLAPDVMWAGADATAVYVHIKSKLFEHTGCLKPTSPRALTLPQAACDKAGQRTFGRDESFTLELTVLSHGNVIGPVTRHFQIAQASIKGSIYYKDRWLLRGGSATRLSMSGCPAMQLTELQTIELSLATHHRSVSDLHITHEGRPQNDCASHVICGGPLFI